MSSDANVDYLTLREASLETVLQVLMKNPDGEQQYFVDHSLTAAAIIYGSQVLYCYPEYIFNFKGTSIRYIGKSIEELVYPDDLAIVEQFLRSFYQESSPMDLLRFRMFDKDKNPVWVEITGQPVEYQGKPSVLVMATSLTNNLRKLRFIQEYTDSYRTFAEKSPDGIVVRRGNSILYANSRAIERIGYSLDALRNMDAFMVVAPDDVKATRELVLKWEAREETPKFIQIRLVDAAGKIITCEVATSFINYHGQPAVQHTFRDISYRVSMQKELQLQDNLLSNINDCIIVTNSNYEIVFWNRGAERLLGWKGSEAIGHGLETIFNNADLLRELYEHLQSENGNWEGELIDIETRGGELISIKLSVSTISDDWGQSSVVIIAGNITELLNAQRSEKQANQAKSEFLARLSHELRTPLVGILGYCELLIRGNHCHEEREELVTVEHCARQLLDLANNMLDLSKIEARQVEINLQEIDLHNLINYTVNSFYTDTTLDVELSVDISTQVPHRVIGDPAKIKQVLINLLSNAIKYTRQGYIKVKVDLEHRSKADNSCPVVIVVRDTGPGVTQNDRERIFEPFVHDVNSTGQSGTGLGLAICKQMVELMGGRIWCQPNLEGGSDFVFILPLEPSVSQQAVGNNADVKNFAGLKILLAEDVSVNRKLISLMLEKIGCRVVAVSNGQECLQALEKFRPDIIMMDMQMPVLDGYSAAYQIKQDSRLHTIPIVALTAHAMTGDIKKCQEAGCNHYLSKPFTGEQLAHILGECLNNSSCIIKSG